MKSTVIKTSTRTAKSKTKIYIKRTQRGKYAKRPDGYYETFNDDYIIQNSIMMI